MIDYSAGHYYFQPYFATCAWPPASFIIHIYTDMLLQLLKHCRDSTVYIMYLYEAGDDEAFSRKHTKPGLLSQLAFRAF